MRATNQALGENQFKHKSKVENEQGVLKYYKDTLAARKDKLMNNAKTDFGMSDAEIKVLRDRIATQHKVENFKMMMHTAKYDQFGGVFDVSNFKSVHKKNQQLSPLSYRQANNYDHLSIRDFY